MRTYLYYLKYIRPYKFLFILLFMIALPLGMMDGAVAWAIKPFLDGLIEGKNTINLSYIPVFIIGFSLVQGGLNYLLIYLNGYLSQKITQAIRKDAFEKLLQFNLISAHTKNSGYIITRFFNDPNRVQMALLGNVKTLLSRFSSTLSIVTVMLILNWRLALIAIFTLLFILTPLLKIKNKIFAFSHDEANAGGGMINVLNSTFSGIKTIRSYSMQKEMRKRFGAAQRMAYHRMMNITRTQALISPFTYFITSIGVSIILWQGSNMILTGEMSPGALVAFVGAVIMLYKPMRNIGDTVINTHRMMSTLERVIQLFEDSAILEKNTSSNPPVGPLKDKIEFRDVSFGYRNPNLPGKPRNIVLNNANFTIKKGEVVALVGKSGAGKTTIAELMMGLYTLPKPTCKVLYDGVDVREVNLETLRKQFSYVSQDTFLFDGTLRENIRLGKFNATDEEIEAAIERAYIKDFIDSLPDGLDTEIGERGVMLSGGQRQRISIARAFLKNAPILILDEATSSLDNEAEARIQESLNELMQNRTVLVITHRLSSIQKVDRILVLDEGTIKEQGSHDELIAKRGIYYHLYYALSNGLEDEDALNSRKLPKRMVRLQPSVH